MHVFNNDKEGRSHEFKKECWETEEPEGKEDEVKHITDV